MQFQRLTVLMFLSQISWIFTFPVPFEKQYGVILDAGSSSTKLRVYSWETRPGSIPVLEEIFYSKVTPGISAFKNDVSDIPKYIKALVDAIKDSIPESVRSVTPAYFMATAAKLVTLCWMYSNQMASTSWRNMLAFMNQKYDIGKMHSFSIDNITGDSGYYRSPPADMSQHYYYLPGQQYQVTPEFPDTYSRTPSPADSGIGAATSPTDSGTDSTTSPTISPKPSSDNVEETLTKLSEKSASFVTPEVSTEKPRHTFMALVSMAILSSPDRKLLLGDIYQYVMDNFPYYNNDQKAWRNSIRHNLSLNECFIKAGRSEGKSNYWAIHPAVADDFANGDFRRRQARRKSRSKAKSASSDVGRSTATSSGYVAMTPSSYGYHPYSSAAYYPHHGSQATTSGQQQTSPGSTPAPAVYTPNGGYSDAYQYGYPSTSPTTSQTTSPTAVPSSGYFSGQLTTPSFDMMMSQSGTYNYNNIASGTFPTVHTPSTSPPSW